MRGQSGTNSLRALVYMDEIFGYFPPVADPPSKQPLLTLLKQARAYGVGLVLATQNPVDLDYRGLANIGSWFIGRLQTDRDKARVLEGLEGAAAGRGVKFDRAAAEQLLAGLASRIFLLHNVHDDEPDIFESRWAMSYLRGPLSRSQIKSLNDAHQDTPSIAPPAAAGPAGPSTPVAPVPVGGRSSRPVLPPQVPQFFAPVRGVPPPGSTIIYQPRVLGSAQVRYANAKFKVDLLQDLIVATEITDSAVPVDWTLAEELAITANQLEKSPVAAEFASCPPAAGDAKNYAAWAKDFATWIQNQRRLTLLRSPSLGQVSKPGEEERDFRIRLRQAAREARDEAAEKLRAKYAPKMATLQERLRRAEAARQREIDQAKRAKMDTVISFGSTLLGAFLGRRAVSLGTVSKAGTAMRSAGRAMGQAGDVGRAEETVAAVQQQLENLESQFEAEKMAQTEDLPVETLETIELSPTRSNINVRLVALVWLPFIRAAAGVTNPAY